MTSLRIATVQFENRSNDKAYNLQEIRSFSRKAAVSGCHVIAFHECSVTGYTFARGLTEQELREVAETVPNGPSSKELIEIAKESNITILAGLFERVEDSETGEECIYNTYICVSPLNGGQIIARHRKLHPFISQYLSAGNEYTVFTLPGGWKAGILICYDNNVIENVRATALLGAEVIFMPHVTMCTPSTRPGAGFVDAKLWDSRDSDPTTLRAEFNGLKGRSWLMKWLPARAYDNGTYVVFSNPIGMDADQLKNGCSMILDPFGDILCECTALGPEFVSALCVRDKLLMAGGQRYRQARRPVLYREILGIEHESSQNVSWLQTHK